MRRLLSSAIGVLTALALVFGLAPAASANAAIGWTALPSDYATSSDTPRFQMCRVSHTATKTTLKYRATRPNGVAISINASWNTKADWSGVGSSAYTDQWTNNRAAVKAVDMPRTGVVVISWQSRTVGYGFTMPKPPRVNVSTCP